MELDLKRVVPTTDGIMKLQEALLSLDQVEIPTLELVSNGLYTREIIIPAGTALVSRVWLEPYIDIMISGDITVVTPEGNKRYKGYNLFVGTPGRKRAGYAHEDTVWVSVHRTEAKSHEGLLELMSVPNLEDFLALENKK